MKRTIDARDLIGIWELVSIDVHWPDGRISQPWGQHPSGRVIYTNQGEMIALLMHQDRNRAAGGELCADLPDEYLGYYGSYSIDTANECVIHDIKGSLRDLEVGSVKRAIAIDNDLLTLTAFGLSRRQVRTKTTLIFRRVRQTA